MSSLDSLPVDLFLLLIMSLNHAADARALVLTRDWGVNAWHETQADWLIKWRPESAYHITCASGLVLVLESLMKRRQLGLNSKNDVKMTPLHFAAIANKAQMIRMLLSDPSHGVNINSEDAWGQTALYKASSKGNLEAARALILLGGSRININAEDDAGLSPLGVAVSLTEPSCTLVSLLIQAKAACSRGGGDGEPIFHRACSLGRVWSVQHLATIFPIKALIQSRSQGDGATPLHRACQAGQVLVAEALLKLAMSISGGMKGLIEARDGGMRNSLHLTCSSGSAPTIDLILGGIDDSDLTALVNARDEAGRTPLHHLLLSGQAKGKRLECVEMLMEIEGLDVTSSDVYGTTALMLAEGWAEVCELIKMGGG